MPSADVERQALAEKCTEAMHKVIRLLVAAVNQRVLTVDDFHPGAGVVKRSDIRIVLQSAGHGVRTSVTNMPGYRTCRSRTAAVSMTMSPGDWKLRRTNCFGMPPVMLF